MMRLLAVTALTLFLASAAVAQPVGDTKILIPLVVENPVPGAFGSLWTTRIAVLNTSTHGVSLDNYERGDCRISCGEFRLTPPGVTFYPRFFGPSNETDGVFLFTTRSDLPFISVAVHAQDLSRQSLTWGTEIPVVSELEAATGPLILNDLPIGDRFRSRLRIYDFDATVHEPARRVRYDVYAVRSALSTPFTSLSGPSEPPDTLLTSGELTFRLPATGPGDRPGFTFLDLHTLRLASPTDRVRVVITPLQPLRYWAFVSVTNNETQHITTVSP